MNLSSGIERRTSLRIPINLGLQIYAYGMLVANGRTVEMSEHGLSMCIEQDTTDEALDPGKHLDVMLHDFSQRPIERWLPIKIVRRWEAGIAGCFVGMTLTA